MAKDAPLKPGSSEANVKAGAQPAADHNKMATKTNAPAEMHVVQRKARAGAAPNPVAKESAVDDLHSKMQGRRTATKQAKLPPGKTSHFVSGFARFHSNKTNV